jgi:hypothetical protein
VITLAKLKIFAGYRGDIDMISRSRRLDDEDCYMIDTLIQDAVVIDRKLGSEKRTAEAIERIRDNCENSEVIGQLHAVAEKLSKPRRKFFGLF